MLQARRLVVIGDISLDDFCNGPSPRRKNSVSPASFSQSSIPAYFIANSRGSLPAVIFLAMFQATPVAQEFGPQAYIVSIVASICFSMQPRAKFIQTVLSNVLLSCLAACITLLGLWCAQQAKLHTQSPGDTNPYNSSAAAVSAIFLFFNLFVVNAFRAVCPPT
jgi:hypothetical protein